MKDSTSLKIPDAPIVTSPEEQDASKQRRDFIKKYGKLAAVTPVAMILTMHSKTALASDGTSHGNSGQGGGNSGCNGRSCDRM